MPNNKNIASRQDVRNCRSKAEAFSQSELPVSEVPNAVITLRQGRVQFFLNILSRHSITSTPFLTHQTFSKRQHPHRSFVKTHHTIVVCNSKARLKFQKLNQKIQMGYLRGIFPAAKRPLTDTFVLLVLSAQSEPFIAKRTQWEAFILI